MNPVFTRRSIRRFEERAVEPEKIEQILRAAMAAPSAGNQQPWEFYVVTDKEKILQLSKSHKYAGCAAGAPAVIVPCFRTENLVFPMYDQIDLSIATQNILLEIVNQGLGGVWLGIAPIEERMRCVDEIIGIEEGLRSFALVPLGYPAEEKPPADRFEPERIHYL